jgi:hypothetical protein
MAATALCAAAAFKDRMLKRPAVQEVVEKLKV